MIEKKVFGSTTVNEENDSVEFEPHPLSVKLTASGRQQLDDIVRYYQVNQSNVIRMAISKLHKEIFSRGG